MYAVNCWLNQRPSRQMVQQTSPGTISELDDPSRGKTVCSVVSNKYKEVRHPKCSCLRILLVLWFQFVLRCYFRHPPRSSSSVSVDLFPKCSLGVPRGPSTFHGSTRTPRNPLSGIPSYRRGAASSLFSIIGICIYFSNVFVDLVFQSSWLPTRQEIFGSQSFVLLQWFHTDCSSVCSVTS